MATLGQLGVVRAVSQLGELLLRSSEDTLTRTYAASALGRIVDARAIQFLGQAVAEKNDMVRRQVALALGRTRHPNAIPHFLKLLNDKSKHISSVAATELRAYEKELNVKLGVKLKPSTKGEKQNAHLQGMIKWLSGSVVNDCYWSLVWETYASNSDRSLTVMSKFLQ